jgi:hypothetical protein
MKRKDTITLVVAAVVCAFFALVLSLFVFKSSAKKANVPTAESISTNFPDVRNDPKYKAIFYEGARDPALPIKIDTTKNPNSQPFNGTQ